MHTENAPWYETAFAAHYPLLYQHRDEAEARHCVDLLPRLAPLGEGTILDLGCGGGRHLELIAARGGRAVGLDLSADLLRLSAFGFGASSNRSGPHVHLVSIRYPNSAGLKSISKVFHLR